LNCIGIGIKERKEEIILNLYFAQLSRKEIQKGRQKERQKERKKERRKQTNKQRRDKRVRLKRNNFAANQF
jgi:hypothetical protein